MCVNRLHNHASIQLYKEEMPYYKMWLALVAEQIVGSLTPNSLG